MDLKAISTEFHRETARHGLIILVCAVTLVAAALLMIGIADLILYKCFGVGLLVAAPMLGFKGLHVRNVSRYHEQKIIPDSSTTKLNEAQRQYIARSSQQQDHQKRKSTYIIIGLMICSLAGMLTPYKIPILVSSLAMLLVVAVEYCYAIVTEFRLTDLRIKLDRYAADQ